MNLSFPRIITLLRTERKLTQKQAAEALGISQALLSHYERGIRECGLEFLVKAADFYSVSCDYLLGRTPYRTGAQLTVDDIPEADSNSEDKRFRGSAVPVLNKRLIVNSLNILFDLLRRVDCRALTNEASAYIMLAVYKVFRQLYLINPKNAKSFFSVNDALSRGYSSAAMEIVESKMRHLALGGAIGGQSGVESPEALELSEELLTGSYPQYSASLLSLMRTAESRMKIE